MQLPRWIWWAGWGEPLLTAQVVSQGGEREAGKGAIISLGAVDVRQMDGHPEGPCGEEADKDGAQHTHDDEEDEEGGLGVDGGTHQAHKEAESQQHGAVEQLVPVALGQDMDTCAHFLPWAKKSQNQWGSEWAALGAQSHQHCARHDTHQITCQRAGRAVLAMLGTVLSTPSRALELLV